MMNDLIRTSLCATKKRFTGIANILDFEKEIGFAGQIINKKGNEFLKKIALENVPSLQQAIVNVALTGLSLNPVLSLVYLVPQDGAIQLRPSYQGLSKILTDTGSVVSVVSGCVFENDFFDYLFGTETFIKHKPTLGERGKIVASWASAKLPDGSEVNEVLSLSDINQLMSLNESVKKGKFSAWTNWKPDMARAKAVRRLYKSCPKSDKRIMEISNILQLDNDASNVDFKAEKAEFQKKQAQKADDGLFSDVEIVQEMPEQEPQEIKVVIDNEDENIELDRLAKEQESK